MMPQGVAAVGARIADIEARFGPRSSVPQTPAAFSAALEQAAVAAGVGKPIDAATQVRAGGVSSAPSVEQDRTRPWWGAALPEAGRAWAASIEHAARQAGIEPELLGAVVQAESGFRPDAVSSAGAIGLAQLMPQTAAALGVDPHDPEQNLLGGARYLRAQLDRFGAVDLALAAYNAGPGRVVDAGGVPQIPETVAYLDRVRTNYLNLR